MARGTCGAGVASYCRAGLMEQWVDGGLRKLSRAGNQYWELGGGVVGCGLVELF